MDNASGTVWRENTSGKSRLRWFGHGLSICDGYNNNIGKRMLTMELPGRWKQGRARRWFMDGVREDVSVVEVTEEDADDRTKP